MKTRHVLVLIVMMILICGCQDKQDSEVSKTNIDIVELNNKRSVSKNEKIFENNDQGKHDLLMLMANSVDNYNLVSGKMISTLGYQGEESHNEYIFQINIPEYQSYLYQAGTNELEDQVIFRDSQKMYFFMGKLEDLNNDLNELINKQMMSVEEVSQETNLFKYKELSLEQRIADINISRVANDLFGDVAPYLFPEDIALRQLGNNYSNYNIIGNEKYLERNTIKVEGKISDDLYANDSSFSMLVDQETGIVLKYQRVSSDSKVEMKMESISIDQEDEENMYAKYINYK